MKRVVIAVVVLVVVVAYFSVPAVGAPSGLALNHSLTEQAEGKVLLNETYPCVPRGERRFTCEIYDSRGSGLVPYSVLLEGRCWRARKVGEGIGAQAPPLPARPAGCVSLRDQMRRLEGFL